MPEIWGGSTVQYIKKHLKISENRASKFTNSNFEQRK